MRIGLDVHVLHGAAQGTASIWRNLLPALPSEHTYILYSFDPAATRAEFPGAHFEHRGIPIKQPHLRIELLYPLLARRDRCQVFHVNYFGPIVGAPGLVVSFPDVLFLDFPEMAPLSRRLSLKHLGRTTALAARAIVTASQYSKARIAHHYRIPAERITVIHDSLDASWTAPDHRALDAAWAGLASRLPERYVLGVGRLEPRKNVVLTARIVRELKALGLTDALVWVGADDFGTPQIERQLREEGLADIVVRLRGLTTPEIQAVYRRAQIMLFLSLAEGFGYPPVEAMAMGTPVVSANRTSLPEVVGDGAWVVDPDDPRAIAHAARTILTMPDVRERLVAAGRARSAMLSPAEAAAHTVALYTRIVHRNGSMHGE
jgi:glycosyltransferase involved in cell wall biosynthesis